VAEGLVGAIRHYGGGAISSADRKGADWRATESGEHCPYLQCVGQWIGLPARVVDQVSGHSTRVGATQDLLALNIQELLKS
jgi:hypothetical protein